MEDAEYKESVIKKFNILISLILDLSEDKKLSITEKVNRLRDYDLKPAEIGEILNKKSNYISAVIKNTKGKK
jgi:hypothetical protein